jgi:adenylate kinase family enzyme
VSTRRILINGPSGSGKTTLGRRLGEALGVPHIELDALMHMPGWQERDPNEFRADIAARLVAAPDGWVVDGNYTQATGSLVLDQADLIVWLRLPFWRVYPALAWRTLRRAITRQELWNGNHEEWHMMFSRESMLLWGITAWRLHHKRLRERLRTERPPHVRVAIVRSRRQMDRLVRRLEAEARAAALGGSSLIPHPSSPAVA